MGQMSPPDNLDIYSLGRPVPLELRQAMGLGGVRLEFFSDGTYRLFVSFPDMNGAEIKALRKGKINTRLFRAPYENPLLQGAFLSFFKFGELGPLEIFFNPALCPRSLWRERAAQNRSTNILSVVCADSRSWKWVAFRLATMPVTWKAALDAWWGRLESIADAPGITREEIVVAVDKWKTPFDARGLVELWDGGEDTGTFGENI